MEYVFNPIDPKSANPLQFKGAPNIYERTCTANLPAITVGRKITPGVAASPPQNGIPLRAGWAAGGDFSHAAHTWYSGAEPKLDGPVTKFPSYKFQHTNWIGPSA